MNQEKKLEYYKIMERLTDMMNQPEGFDREAFVACLNEFCDFFNISKGVTEFYQNIKFEDEGKGEVLIDRDTGVESEQFIQRRITPRTGVILKGTLFRPKDAEPLTEEEFRIVDIVHRQLMSFIARNRLQRTVYKFGYFDEDDYPNRRAFMRYLDEKIQKHEQYGYTAACINLRHFSLINQDIGRPMGDVVFRNYFKHIEDTIGGDGIVVRLGGDNFILFFRTELKPTILRIFAGVPVYYDENNKDKYVMVAARAGVYDVTEKEPLVAPGQIMDKVYPAIQVARQRGLAVVYYDEEMDKRREKIMTIRHQFAQGLTAKEFKAYYQPKVDVNTGKVVGAEALCRWFHDGKMVMPMDFIPILERNNDICRLDLHMLDIVSRDIRRWLDEGRDVPRISVNLSRRHLTDPNLLDKIIRIIDNHGVPHEYIEIELTETTTDVEFKELNKVVCGLQQEGIYTSVDDFGNGYSSLNLIRTIPWNVIKIDRTLIPEDEEKSEGNTNRLFEHVVAIAHDIGMECVSEGVETVKQVGLLRKNNCRIAQGFYFEKPLPVEEFEPLLDGTPYLDKLKEIS